MKKTKYLILLMMVALFIVSPHARIADSGFDSSYDGGGGYSSSDSSWSSSDSYSSHSSYSLDGSSGGSSFTLYSFFEILFVLGILYAIISSSIEQAYEYNRNKYANLRKQVDIIDDNNIAKVIEAIKEVYPNFNYNILINDALVLYKEYSEYMNNRDLDSVKTIVDGSLYRKSNDILLNYKTNNNYSIVKDIKFNRGFIEFLDFFNNTISARVVLGVKEIQYFVDKDYNYIRGNKDEIESTTYTITISKVFGANRTIMTNKVICSNPNYLVSEYDSDRHNSYESMQEILKIDPKLTENNIVDKTFKLYEELQYAWSNFDYDKMRTLVSDELYNNYRMQLRTLNVKKQRNVMEDISFVRGAIKHYELTESSINISVELVVEQNDYIVDDIGNIVKGDKIKDHNTYELLITRAISKHKENCPNCGAELRDEASQTCSHCGASLITLSKDFVIAKKRILKQR